MPTQLQQTLRKQAGFPWLETTAQDIGGAFRYFRRNRKFFAVAVVILALGIGATTAVFSVAETLLLRPLPYPESDRLVTLRSVDTMSDYPSTRVAPGLLADWQIKATSFETIAGYRWATVDLIDGAQSDRLSGLLATPEFFDVFGVPLLGRSFHGEDRGAGSAGTHSRRGSARLHDRHTFDGSADRRFASRAPCGGPPRLDVRGHGPRVGRGRRL